jgi:hypothetical protein
MQALTHFSRWSAWIARLVLCATLAGLSLVPAARTAAADDPDNPAQASPSTTARPLAELLNPDGTLDLARGWRGSLDARSWRLASGPGEAPRFAPLAAPGDENWADNFISPGTSGLVYAVALDGEGKLYASGWFTTAGGVSANHVAMWDGSSWSALGSGMDGPSGPTVYALALDGSGDHTWAAGLPRLGESLRLPSPGGHHSDPSTCP